MFHSCRVLINRMVGLHFFYLDDYHLLLSESCQNTVWRYLAQAKEEDIVVNISPAFPVLTETMCNHSFDFHVPFHLYLCLLICPSMAIPMYLNTSVHLHSLLQWTCLLSPLLILLFWTGGSEGYQDDDSESSGEESGEYTATQMQNHLVNVYKAAQA